MLKLKSKDGRVTIGNWCYIPKDKIDDQEYTEDIIQELAFSIALVLLKSKQFQVIKKEGLEIKKDGQEKGTTLPPSLAVKFEFVPVTPLEDDSQWDG